MILRRIALIAATPFAALALYVGAGFALGAIPTGDPPAAGPVQLAVIANPFHSDLVMPAEGWTELLGLPPEARYVAIGWGDLAFYVGTPTLGDLKLATMAEALSGTGPATIHVYWFVGEIGGPSVHPLPVTAAQAAALTDYIRAGFAETNPAALPGLSYGMDDLFFPAKGHWSPYTTCNEWLARGLRRAGIRTGLWAPFAPGVLSHLPA